MVGNSIGIRWTIGDVSADGFEALRLSVWGAYKSFGDAAAYAICVNTVPLAIARLVTGELPAACTWHEVAGEVPPSLVPFIDGEMAQGAAWKLAPLRMFPDRYELALDNDCILWSAPEPIRRWVETGDRACVLAEDVRRSFGEFAAECGPAPRNAGLRGLPPSFDLERAMLDVLGTHERVIASELDEQGLQVAALSSQRTPIVVTLSDVTICSPFPPHLPHLGRCGAHFRGLNARDLGWQLDGHPASSFVRAHWRARRAALYDRVGLPIPADTRNRPTIRARVMPGRQT